MSIKHQLRPRRNRRLAPAPAEIAKPGKRPGNTEIGESGARPARRAHTEIAESPATAGAQGRRATEIATPPLPAPPVKTGAELAAWLAARSIDKTQAAPLLGVSRATLAKYAKASAIVPRWLALAIVGADALRST